MKKGIYYLLAFYALVCVLSIWFFDGTGDAGDSVTHYLFARYAPKHPILYFDHWAKPVFVLLASPFAQFGFAGMKLFNSLVALAILWLTYKTARQLNLRNALLTGVFLIFSPLFYILTFSGLTEPLFALFTIAGVYWGTRQRYLACCFLLSFLPYVRSEGLVIIGVFVLYLLIKKQWRYLPWLLSGSVVFGLAGLLVHKSFFWVLTEIPYAHMSSVYGKGTLFHFVEELLNVTGIPVNLLFWTGFLSLVVLALQRKLSPEWLLILLGFTCYFVAHSLFWYLGIFNSMGLKRVLIGVMPLIALIALKGFDLLTETWLSTKPVFKKVLGTCILIYVVIFPFTPNPSAVQWHRDMHLSAEQQFADSAATFITQKHLHSPLLFHYRYLCLPLQLDYFDVQQSRRISTENIAAMKAGDLLVWDNFYTVFESGFEQAQLNALPELSKLRSFSSVVYGRGIRFVVYAKK